MSTEQPKSHRAGLPAPVSMKDRDAAIADLRSSRWLDVDAFLSDIKPERLLHSRLGPSGDCLTVDDLSRLDLVGSVSGLPHLAACEPCFEAVRTYAALRKSTLDSKATRHGNVWISHGATIVLGPHPVEFDLVLESDIPIAAGQVQASLGSVFNRISCAEAVPLFVPHRALNPSRAVVVGLQRSHAATLLEAEPITSYQIRFVGQPSIEIIKKMPTGYVLCDRLKLSGKFEDGRSFDATDLVRLQRQEAL